MTENTKEAAGSQNIAPAAEKQTVVKEQLKAIPGLIGKKVGMTRIFSANGEVVPVTLIRLGPCYIAQLKDAAKDGYNAVQLGWEKCRENKVTKPELGHFKKVNLEPFKFLREFRLNNKPEGMNTGDEIKVDIFAPGAYVDIEGVTKGKGFAGVVKRHNFRGGPRTHGQSDRLRAPGASGSQGPQHVQKGKKFPGHMGNNQKTVQKLKVIEVNPEENLLVVKGSTPGPNNSLLIVKRTVKRIKIKKIPVAAPVKQKGKGKAPETQPKKKSK